VGSDPLGEGWMDGWAMCVAGCAQVGEDLPCAAATRCRARAGTGLGYVWFSAGGRSAVVAMVVDRGVEMRRGKRLEGIECLGGSGGRGRTRCGERAHRTRRVERMADGWMWMVF